MTNRERLIREIAYDLWEQEGRPEGHSERLWLAAEARFETEIAERRDERSEPPVEPAVETPPRPTKRKADAAADELEPAPSRSGSKDADTSLKSGISGRTQRATPFNRPPAKEPISLNSNSTRTKPTPTRSKDAKTSPVSSGARPQPTNANANRAEARIARGKTKSATPPIRSPGKAPKQDVGASEPVAPPLEPKSRRGAQTIAAKWTKWKKQKARHS